MSISTLYHRYLLRNDSLNRTYGREFFGHVSRTMNGRGTFPATVTVTVTAAFQLLMTTSLSRTAGLACAQLSPH